MNTPENSAPILFERRGAIALITLNRPEQLNSVDSELAMQLGEALERVQNDPEIRVGVITGAGRAFCAGMDLGEFAAGKPMPTGGNPDWGFAGAVNHPIDKPLIAAVNGAAVGGGLEIALSCDLICVDEGAKLGLPEVKRGLFAAGGGLLRIGQQAPLRVGLEIALTGRLFTPAEALGWGLVNRVAPAGTVLEAALELAEQIVEVAPLAVRASKRVVYGAQHMTLTEAEAWRLNAREMEGVFDSNDAREGARAFTEKRAPNWTGA